MYLLIYDHILFSYDSIWCGFLMTVPSEDMVQFLKERDIVTLKSFVLARCTH